MRKATLVAIVALALPALSGCGPESRDFKREAERLIESDNASRLPMDYAEASCDVPTSMAQGTTFTCSAVGVDGASYVFETQITGARKFVVTLDGAG